MLKAFGINQSMSGLYGQLQAPRFNGC